MSGSASRRDTVSNPTNFPAGTIMPFPDKSVQRCYSLHVNLKKVSNFQKFRGMVLRCECCYLFGMLLCPTQ